MSKINDWVNEYHIGDCRDVLSQMPESSVHMSMTSPPYYGLRDYGEEEQLGLEDELDDYVDSIVAVGEDIRRVLRDDGSWWLNLGDTYAGGGGVAGKPDDWDDLHMDENYPSEPPARDSRLPRKNKMLIPHRVAIGLQEAGWTVRNDVVWMKPNPMPYPVRDRMVTSFEFLFHLTPSPDYWYDKNAISEDNGRNPRDVVEINVKPFSEAHFAVFPPELCERPIQASCPPEVCAECGSPHWTMEWGDGKVCDCETEETNPGIALDPFAGAGTLLHVAKKYGRRWIGIDLNDEYKEIALNRDDLENAPLGVEHTSIFD